MPPATSASPAAAERIRRAQLSVRRAFEQWRAADLERIGQCRELLEQAVGELREAARTGASTHPCLPVDVRRALAAIKQDTAGMTRVVDACSTFQRGLALRLGRADPNYDAAGLTPADEVVSSPRMALDV